MEELELVGSAEIQDMLCLSRQRIDQLSRDPSFPKPVAELAIRVWRRSDVEEWALEKGYAIYDS